MFQKTLSSSRQEGPGNSFYDPRGGWVSKALKNKLALKFHAFWAWINTPRASQYFLDRYYVFLVPDRFIFDVYRIFREHGSNVGLFHLSVIFPQQ